MYFPMAAVQTHRSLSRSGQCEFVEVDEDDLDTSGLHVRAVRPETAQYLLSEPQSSSRSSTSNTDIDAEALLSDLGQLASTVAKHFVTKETARETFTLRFINDVDFTGDEDSYIALSYCWNRVGRDIPRRLVSPVGDLPFGWVKTVEQFPLPTSSQMFEAVLRERKRDEGLWFDQVCINQEDEAEKSAAIGATDLIYQNASTVIVALDDIAAGEDEMEFLRHYVGQYARSEVAPGQQPNVGLDPPLMQQFPPLKLFFERIISSIWFERAWCAHEMRIGQSHVFLVPGITTGNEDTYNFVRFTGPFFTHLLVLASELSPVAPALQSRIDSLLKLFENLQYRPAKHSPTSSPQSIPQSISFVPTVSEVFRMKAGGNPRLPEYLRRLDANRDKTSIALNVARLPLALKPSSPLQRPSIEDECLRQLLLIGLAARDPVTLCTTGSPLQLHDGSVSWLCRPTPIDVPSNSDLPPPPRFPPPSKSSSAIPISQASDGRAEYVQLDLIFLELPHRNQPNPHFATHIQRARSVIDICIQYHVYATHEAWDTWQAWHVPNHPRAAAMRNIFIQTLACVFDCGAVWLRDVCRSLHASSSSTYSIRSRTLRAAASDPTALDPLMNPQVTPIAYIQLPEGHHSFTLMLHILSTLISSGIPWASGATERTHGPLIISTPPPPPPPAGASSSSSSLSSTAAAAATAPPPPSPPPSATSSSTTFTSTSSASNPYLQPTSNTNTPASYTSTAATSIITSYPLSPHPPPPPPPPPSFGKALTFAPFQHSKTLLVAVPAAVSADEYETLARGWVLTSMNPFTGTGAAGSKGREVGVVSWTLQGKGRVFGDRGFVAGLREGGRGGDRESGVVGAGAGAKKKTHRVYGPGAAGGGGGVGGGVGGVGGR